MLSRVTLLLALALIAACSQLHATVRYTVTLADPVRHLVQVAMEIPPGRNSHELQLPVWNALYQVRDFAQYMDSIRATGPAGNVLPLMLLNKSRWHLTGAEKGARIEYQMFSNDPGPYGAEFNQQHAFFNLAEVLLYADDTRGDENELEFRNIPAGWKTATSLSPQGPGYEAKNYDALVDAPVEMGTFEENDFSGDCGRYRVVVDGANAASILAKIVPPIQRIVNSATAWMNDCPFQTYTFIYHFGSSPSTGGMEHAFSTAIALPTSDIDDLERLTSITAHEFFHLWNVKRLRPQSLEPVDYTREDYTDALWFSEGTDTTAADSIRLHAGLLDETRYLDRLSQAITELESRPAHLTQSVEQSSLDAWLEKYPHYGLPERSISYYNKGELLGVVLDLKIRELTHGRQSLQSLFREMNNRYAKQGKFFADSDGVRNAVEEITGADFRDFFTQYVAGVREIPWNSFFSYVGLRASTMEVEIARSGFEAVREFNGPPIVVTVQPGSEAEQAGLKADDELVSINGIAAGRDFERQIEAIGPGGILRLRIRRNGAPRDLQWKLGAQRVKVYRLEDLPSITPEQKTARRQWLYGSSQPTR
jgi:predicted metalloprotease with PDZ domain